MGLIGDLLNGAFNAMNDAADKASEKAEGMRHYSDERLLEEYAKAKKGLHLYNASAIASLLQERGYDRDDIDTYANIHNGW